jgi:hypothetical protein
MAAQLGGDVGDVAVRRTAGAASPGLAAADRPAIRPAAGSSPWPAPRVPPVRGSRPRQRCPSCGHPGRGSAAAATACRATEGSWAGSWSRHALGLQPAAPATPSAYYSRSPPRSLVPAWPRS